MVRAMEQQPHGVADAAKRVLLAVLAAAAVGALWTVVETGALLPEVGGLTALAERALPLMMMAAVVALQRYGLLPAIATGIGLAFVAVVTLEGAMASWAWIGEFFLRALKMMIVPLVVFAMITAITGLGDIRKLGRLGGRTVLYYLVTTALAVVVGAVLVNLIRPGEGLDVSGLEVPERVAAKRDLGLPDIFLGFLSDNIVGSMAQLQMLPIIVFSLAFGAALTTVGEVGRPVVRFCEGGNAAMMKLVLGVMQLAPVGVFGLVAGRFGREMAAGGTEAFLRQLEGVAGYSGTVLAGLAAHGLLVIPLILYFTTGRSPLAYARGMAGALLTAFSTASSAATLPMTLEATEKDNGVDPRASQFVVSLGATVNMDGTALYEAVAVIFIAQALGVDLSFGQQIVIILTATLAAIGAAGIPEAGLVTMVIVLQAVHLPLEGVELILAVDWLLDRFRTTVNVWGDSVGAAVMERHGLEPAAPLPAPTSPPPSAA